MFLYLNMLLFHMKKLHLNIFFLLCFLVFSTSGSSQSTLIDSLKLELQNHKTKDTVRAYILLDIGHYYHTRDYDKALKYLDESIELSDSLNYKIIYADGLYFKGVTKAIKTKSKEGPVYFNKALKVYLDVNDTYGIAQCNDALGVFYTINEEYDKSIKYFLEAKKIKKERGDNKGVLKAIASIASAHNRKGNYSEAILSFKKAIKIAEEIKDEKQKAICLSDIGNIYGHQGNHTLALEYHFKSMNIGKDLNDSKIMCDALISIGNIHSVQENPDKAIEYYEKALMISKKEDFERNTAAILSNIGVSNHRKKDYTQALQYYKESLDQYIKLNRLANAPINLNNIGTVYLDLQNYSLANEYFEKAIKANLKINNQQHLCTSYLGIAKVLLYQEKYDLALDHILKSKDIAKNLGLISGQKDAEELLSKIYKSTGNYKKALESHQQFKILNDSLFNKKNIEKIAQLESEFKYKQALDSSSIRELKLTEQVTATSRDLEKSKQNYLWVIIGFLFISMLLGSVIFFQKFRTIKAKNQTIATEQKLLRSQMTPHFIFNSLSVLQGMILNKEDKKSVSYLLKFSKLIRITLENSRDKLVLLSQELLAIENYLALQNLENESYQYSISVNDTINSDVFQIPPMLIQPFVENAIEHAFTDKINPKVIEISLNYSNKNLICTIADNGIGINVQRENKNGHKTSLATTITSERLQILSKDLKINGSVTIEDREKYNSQGTLVTLVIPHKLVEV